MRFRTRLCRSGVALPVAGGLLLAACAGLACSAAGRVVARVNRDVITARDFARVVSAAGADTGTVRRERENLLNSMINQKLIVQQARAAGYGETLKSALEKKWYEVLRQTLHDYAAKLKPSPADIARESLLFVTELHLKVMEVSTWDTAEIVEALARAGVPFESLAVRYNRAKFTPPDGDLNLVPAERLPPIWVAAADRLSPGQASPLVVRGIYYDFVKLVERIYPLPAESIPQYRTQIEALARQRKGPDYLETIRSRVTYDEAALDWLTRNPDSLTPADGQRVVATRNDGFKVRMDGLLPIVRRYGNVFPALRRQALKEDLENDLLEREALRLRLDKTPEFRDEYARQAEGGIYQYYYAQVITNPAVATDSEARSEYQQHPEQYQNQTFEQVAQYIKERLSTDRRQKKYEDLLNGLRRRAKIAIDHKLLMQIKPGK